MLPLEHYTKGPARKMRKKMRKNADRIPPTPVPSLLPMATPPPPRLCPSSSLPNSLVLGKAAPVAFHVHGTPIWLLGPRALSWGDRPHDTTMFIFHLKFSKRPLTHCTSHQHPSPSPYGMSA